MSQKVSETAEKFIKDYKDAINLEKTYNQTDEEKDMGVMRIGKLAHRHADFSETETCTPQAYYSAKAYF